MSYTIVYSRQFIRVPTAGNGGEDIVIPLALSGCNNVTEFVGTRERRARNWDVFGNDKVFITTEQELMDTVRSLYGNTDWECFKYNSQWLDGAGVIKFYQNGCKAAKTMEELRTLKPGLTLCCVLGYYTKNENGGANIYREKPESRAYIRYSDELAEWLKTYSVERDKLLADEMTTDAYLRIQFPLSEPLKLGVRSKAIEGPVVVKSGKGYVTEYTDTSVSCGAVEQALVFESATEARAKLPAWYFQPSYNGKKKSVQFIKAETAKKERPYVIRFKDTPGYAGDYLDHLTRNRLYATHSPKYVQKRFATEKEAQRYFDTKIAPRYIRFKACEIVDLRTIK